MSDYGRVSEALSQGVPAVLCSTCPWDRNCLTPPQMTAKDIEEAMNKAQRDDEEAQNRKPAADPRAAMPMATLLTAAIVGGRDTQATICPVFAVRFRSSAGRSLADGLRSQMQSWDDDA